MMTIKNHTINGILYLVGYQRQGNDKNGNPIYMVNVLRSYQGGYPNINYQVSDYKRDKYDNIKTTSYNIESTIDHILSKLNTL